MTKFDILIMERLKQNCCRPAGYQIQLSQDGSEFGISSDDLSWIRNNAD